MSGKKTLQTLGLIVLSAATATSAATALHQIYCSKDFDKNLKNIKQYLTPAEHYLK
ncbi:hypothetical protein GF358_00280 [Candidatus Woesearchaeota archaeon]|nr:hypothetical protein [Candidatus Woesearchaeota archaeon]